MIVQPEFPFTPHLLLDELAWVSAVYVIWLRLVTFLDALALYEELVGGPSCPGRQ